MVPVAQHLSRGAGRALQQHQQGESGAAAQHLPRVAARLLAPQQPRLAHRHRKPRPPRACILAVELRTSTAAPLPLQSPNWRRAKKTSSPTTPRSRTRRMTTIFLATTRIWRRSTEKFQSHQISVAPAQVPETLNPPKNNLCMIH